MRVLVTGAAGFIGSHLVDSLLARGYDVAGIDDLSMGRLENLAQPLAHPGFHFVQADVRDGAALLSAAEGAAAIVHLAAFKIPRYGQAIHTLLVNAEGIKSVLDVARDIGCRVIAASTSDVYGKSSDLPFTEEGNLVMGPSPVSRWSYAVSKLYEEHLLYAYRESFGVPVTILRFFGCYGPRHHRSWWGGPQAVFIEALLQGRAIEIHGDGLQTRTFTYVSDTVDGIMAALESARVEGEIINLGSTEEISILDLAYLIKRLCGTPGEFQVTFVPYASLGGGRYEDVRRRVPDMSKAKRILDYDPKVPLEEGLRRTIAWQQGPAA